MNCKLNYLLYLFRRIHNLIVVFLLTGDFVEENEDLVVETSKTYGKMGNARNKKNKGLSLGHVMRKYSYKSEYWEWSSTIRKNSELLCKLCSREGFGITIRSSNMRENGKFKCIALACVLSRKSHAIAKNSLQPQLSTKIDCKAK